MPRGGWSFAEVSLQSFSNRKTANTHRKKIGISKQLKKKFSAEVCLCLCFSNKNQHGLSQNCQRNSEKKSSANSKQEPRDTILVMTDDYGEKSGHRLEHKQVRYSLPSLRARERSQTPPRTSAPSPSAPRRAPDVVTTPSPRTINFEYNIARDSPHLNHSPARHAGPKDVRLETQVAARRSSPTSDMTSAHRDHAPQAASNRSPQSDDTDGTGRRSVTPEIQRWREQQEMTHHLSAADSTGFPLAARSASRAWAGRERNAPTQRFARPIAASPLRNTAGGHGAARPRLPKTASPPSRTASP